MTARALPFTGPYLLAPMEGVTDPSFRDLVLARNAPTELGGAFTEFARVVDRPLTARALRAHLGERRFEAPVGLQLMGADLGALAESAARAVEVGAPLVDLNFGCPSKGALRGCAGSALLDDPARLEAVVAACRRGVGDAPLSAKIRAGGDDDARLEDLARAAEAGGADLLTVHCRTRAEGYRDTADWERLRRAVASVSIPVCGNGGVATHRDLERLRRETGCAYAMVGRAALGDPWIFSGRVVGPDAAARFLDEYAERLSRDRASSAAGAAGRIKQLLRHWTAGRLLEVSGEDWLRIADPEVLLALVRALATTRPSRPATPEPSVAAAPSA